jgi:uncharacterized membrane protein YhaH (DUF805 family)
MNFIDSIKAGLQNYANFKGRATRSEYWWFQLFFMLAAIVGSVLHEYVALIALLALFLPTCAVTVRRLHDLDKSGWFYWVSLIPFGSIYILYLFTKKGSEGDNRF